MTAQLIFNLQAITRLMQMAWQAGDKDAYRELEPQFRLLVAQQTELSLAGMVQ